MLMSWAEPAGYRHATQLHTKRWRELEARVLQHGDKWPCSVDFAGYCVRHDAVYMHSRTVERLAAQSVGPAPVLRSLAPSEPLDKDADVVLADASRYIALMACRRDCSTV